MFQCRDLFPSVILKLDGIPWDVRREEILTALHPFTAIGQPPRLHIPMDIVNGKTINCAFVEFGTMEQALACQRHLEMKRPVFHGKIPKTTISDHSELCATVFQGGTLARDDVIKILAVCRNYKRQYNRRCPNRPFDYVISLIQLFPFESIQEATQRDQVFEFHKNAVDLLRLFSKKDFSFFRENLLYELVLCGVLSPGYTLKQREVLVRSSQINLPLLYHRFLEEEETTGSVVKRLKRKTEIPLLGTFAGFGHALKPFLQPNQGFPSENFLEASESFYQRRLELSPPSRQSSFDSQQIVYENQQDIKKLMQLVVENAERIEILEDAVKDLITASIENENRIDNYTTTKSLSMQLESLKCDVNYKINHVFAKFSGGLEPEK